MKHDSFEGPSTIFFPNIGGTYKEQTNMPRFSTSTFPSSVTSFVYEGVAYNWITRALVACGGRQVQWILFQNNENCSFLC